MHDGVVEHGLHRGVQRLGPVEHAQDGPGGVQAPVPQADQQVLDDRGVLGVALHHAQGVLGPVDADAQGHHAQVVGEVHPVDHQRHQVEPDRSAASSSARAVSVAATKRRLTADFDVDRADRVDSAADRLQAGRVAPGRQLGHHPLQRHRAQQLGRGEQLVGRHRHLGGPVGAAHPGAPHRHPAAAEGHRTVLAAVADGGAVGVVHALRARRGR